ncbi:MAG: hypothetical protein KJ044_15400, partial [Planctomycetes bacterium]|nr:hypothetical protein [Planctomycetota bacterium]
WVVLHTAPSRRAAAAPPPAAPGGGGPRGGAPPTPGAVIGTRDIRLSDGTNWRLPSSGFYNIDGMNQERNGCQPHVMVEITPADRLAGRDTQLEKAIEVALDKIRNPANPQPGPVPTPTAPQKEGDFAVPPTEGWLAPVDNPWRYLPPELLR